MCNTIYLNNIDKMISDSLFGKKNHASCSKQD